MRAPGRPWRRLAFCRDRCTLQGALDGVASIYGHPFIIEQISIPMKRNAIQRRPGDPARQTALTAIRVLVGGLRQSARGIERRTGATNAQIFLLQQLAAEPRLSVNDLAERARTNQSTV